jgi:hypothetical protein
MDNAGRSVLLRRDPAFIAMVRTSVAVVGIRLVAAQAFVDAPTMLPTGIWDATPRRCTPESKKTRKTGLFGVLGPYSSV